MQTTIHITDNKKRMQAINLISELPEDGTHQVEISAYSENRSMKQHRLYWKWVTEVGGYMGNDKETMHLTFKEKFAVPIFMRDDEGYAEMVLAVKAVRKSGLNSEADALKRKIVQLTSTTDFNVKQMTEYLNSIEHYSAEIGATITYPDDLYQQAMGRANKRRGNI